MMLSDTPNKYTNKDYIADQESAKKEAHTANVDKWLRENPEVGTLNSGKFYIYPVDGEYQEIALFQDVTTSMRSQRTLHN